MTPRQRQFAHLISDGYSPVEAAKLVGYHHPRQAAYQLLHRPRKVRSLIVARAIEGARRSLPAAVRGAVAGHGQWQGLLSMMFTAIRLQAEQVAP